MLQPDRQNERAIDWNTSPENTEMEITLRANASRPQTRETTANPDHIEDYIAGWGVEVSGLAKTRKEIEDLQRRVSETQHRISELQQLDRTLRQKLSQKEEEQQANVNRLTSIIKQTAGVEDLHNAK